MKNINWSLLALILTLPLLAAAVDTQYMQGIGDTRYHRIESEIIGRGFHMVATLSRKATIAVPIILHPRKTGTTGEAQRITSRS